MVQPARSRNGEDEQAGAADAAQPKHFRGWRSFLREVGIIVLGVLIALVVGEAANAVRQRVEAGRSMEAIRADLIDNSSFELTAIAAGCADRRLNSISHEIALFRKTGRLRDIGEIGSPPITTFRSGSWDSAVSNRDTLFLDKARVADLTDYHELLRAYRLTQDEASLDWARMELVSHAPGPMDDNTLATVKQTIVELRYRTRLIALFARLLLETHKRLGLPVVSSPFNGKPQTREGSLRKVKTMPFCQPLQVAQSGTR